MRSVQFSLVFVLARVFSIFHAAPTPGPSSFHGAVSVGGAPVTAATPVSVRREAILHFALILDLNAMPDESRTINRGDYGLTLLHAIGCLEDQYSDPRRLMYGYVDSNSATGGLFLTDTELSNLKRNARTIE